jgi:hypothetical protein
MPDMMPPKDLPVEKQAQWKKHYSEAMQQEDMTPEKAASMATEKCMQQNQRSNRMKLSISGLLGYLQGKGWKVRLNEGDQSGEEAFEVLDEPVMPEPPDNTMLSEEELLALKGFAQVLAKNGSLTTLIQDGTLDKVITTIPAAAELVKNAQAQQKAEKDALVATIKANSSNIYTDEELASMANPVLVKLNAQLNVNYMGLGGGLLIQNADTQPLAIPSVLLAQAQEVNNGS